MKLPCTTISLDSLAKFYFDSRFAKKSSVSLLFSWRNLGQLEVINFYAKKYLTVMHTVHVKIGQQKVDQFVCQQDICCYSSNCVVLWNCQILPRKSIVLFYFEFFFEKTILIQNKLDLEYSIEKKFFLCLFVKLVKYT